MSDPAVSVVVYISEPITYSFSDTITSATEQSFGAPEIIVVTKPHFFEGETKAEILRRGDSIRYIVSDANATAGDLLRIGADAARGRFIAWLKADDLYDPRKIEKQMDAAASHGSGCVTCGFRILGQPFSKVASGVRQDSSSVINLLLTGGRDAATLLVSRECLTAADGFSPTLDHLPELDLAVQLAVRYPMTHVPVELIRRLPAHASRPERSPEFSRVANRILEDGRETGPIDRLEDLGRVFAGLPIAGLPNDTRALIPSIQRRIAAITGKSQLCVGILPLADGEIANPGTILEMLGVPNAQALSLPRPENYLNTIAALLAGSKADWLVVIDPVAPLLPETFALQLLHSAAEDLDACLPYPDPLVYIPGPACSLIPSTLFRRSPLEKLSLDVTIPEERFWAAFSRLGRIGALPPAAPVERPDRSSVPEAAHSTFTKAGLADKLVALIDRDWYSAMNPDIAGLSVDPIYHFLNTGWRERRQPNPWFHTAWYLARNPQVLERDMNPLEHFVLEGAAAGLRPSPGFDIVWYSKQYLDADRPCAEALFHFLTVGLFVGAVPCPRPRHSPVGKRTGIDGDGTASRHAEPTLSQAEEEQLLEALVDADWYRATYFPDRSAAFNAVAHYIDQGWRQGYNPNPWFDTSWYLSQNDDPQEEGVHPLNHFIRSGAKRGRKPHPFFDVRWYARHYLGEDEPSAEILRHFLTVGLMCGAVPESRIATPTVKQRLLQMPFAERSPLIKRLQNLLSQALATGEIIRSVDADLWPILLAEDFPADAVPVLLICEGSQQSRRLAAAAANVLPPSEIALFGIIENVHTLRVANRLEDSISVKFAAREQDEMLKDLLIRLHCQRASAVEERLLDTPVARMVRNAGVPVYRNGGGVRRAAKRYPLD